jgi:dTDP-glucose 4,6-dehydratase
MCRSLVADGHEVVAYDNLVTGQRRNITDLEGADGFEFVLHDVTEPFDVDGPVDRVMHLASPASPADFHRIPVEILDVGSIGTRNALDVARKKGARFLLASTSEVYGDPLEHPQRESYLGNVNCIGIRGAYDEAKRFAEAMTFAYHRVHDVDIRIVRIFNTFGPGMRIDDGRAITNFLGQALRGDPITLYGDGSQTRSFCFVSDQVRGQRLLLESDHVGPVNIGNDVEITLADLAELVLRITKSSSEIVFEPLPADDPLRRRPDLTLARSVLGFEPSVDVEDGIEQTADYFRAILDEG